MHILIIFYNLPGGYSTQILEIKDGVVLQYFVKDVALKPADYHYVIGKYGYNPKDWTPMVDPAHEMGELFPLDGGLERCQIFIKR